jgi:hypothetical protein
MTQLEMQSVLVEVHDSLSPHPPTHTHMGSGSVHGRGQILCSRSRAATIRVPFPPPCSFPISKKVSILEVIWNMRASYELCRLKFGQSVELSLYTHCCKSVKCFSDEWWLCEPMVFYTGWVSLIQILKILKGFFLQILEYLNRLYQLEQ